MGDGESHLAGTVLDDDVAVLADGAGLLRVRLGGAGVGLGLEVVLLGVRHLRESFRDPVETSNRSSKKKRSGKEKEHIELINF